jgi:ABC-type nickel/cobalt efflux system permease component RcnA
MKPAYSKSLLLALLLAIQQRTLPACLAHPVPRRAHDRTIVVRLGQDDERNIQVTVNYRLEVDEFTVVFDDLPALLDKSELGKLRQPDEFYEAYTRSYAPILAGNLIATLDGRALAFRCGKRSHQLHDENGVPLNHLRCDFVFQAKCEASMEPHRFTFKEANFELEEGLIRLSLAGEASIEFANKTEPDSKLQARPAAELQPGDDGRLRNAAATFVLGKPSEVSASQPASTDTVPPAAKTDGQKQSLLALLLDSQQGFLVLLLLAALFGAAHALTPGHGKTLVAAYLVGERGTMTHAFVLGLVTTITHTGAVFVLAAILLFFFPGAVPQNLQSILGLVGGLLVAGMGFWLLLRRLSGGPDHIHLGTDHHHHGHTHDHSHGHADHYHDEKGQAHALPADVNWWGLFILGISGGIVPCWDAILMLGFAISAQRLWLGVPLLLAFSAGLASVLIVIGIGVVYFKGFATSRWGQGWFVRALPLTSAILVTGMGLWLCYDSLHASPIR